MAGIWSAHSGLPWWIPTPLSAISRSRAMRCSSGRRSAGSPCTSAIAAQLGCRYMPWTTGRASTAGICPRRLASRAPSWRERVGTYHSRVKEGGWPGTVPRPHACTRRYCTARTRCLQFHC